MGDSKRKNVTIHIDSDLYELYSDYCKKEGLVLSRQIEKFIEKELKKNE
ncbi:TPA: hypothetical protein HA235_01195 [Candidatus Woesearchaeota archaeon]|nr:hypothetical protein [Candidatus Woesearchaeota archaeon]HIH31299.1 hypothetical protein [Candidatus Woesearchaeota archaeon]HIH55410.1 hypothetical protein [Candidatus Woesearchaeota archaeon]HIJ01602.1 hypothetical protein [Candidatus Woesearchaeota archaeon]HIJ14601.1 hypothetical protein [Candidatus Woesearchaeota archaeon]